MQIDLILEPDRTPAQLAELGRMAEDHGIRTLWSSNDFSARDVFMSLVPTRGASKRQMFRIGATFADGVMMSAVPPLPPILDESIGIIREWLAELGRWDELFRISNFWAWQVKEDREISLRETLHHCEQARLTETALRLHDDPANATRLSGDQVMPALA